MAELTKRKARDKAIADANEEEGPRTAGDGATTEPSQG
jgi:hypothetical protein